MQQRRAPEAIMQAAANFAIIVQCQEIIGDGGQALRNEEMALLQNERALCDRVSLVQAGDARADADLQSLADVRTKLHEVREQLIVNSGITVNAAVRAGREFGKFGHLIWHPMRYNARHPSYPASVKAPELPGQPEFSEALARGRCALKNREFALNSGWGTPQAALVDLNVVLTERQSWENDLLGQLANADSTSDRGMLHEQLAEVRLQIGIAQGFISRFEPNPLQEPACIHVGAMTQAVAQ